MRILVIRTSAMGDVALLAPVIRSLRLKYPETNISVLTRQVFNPLLSAIPGIDLINPDFKVRHRGFPGLIRLFSDLMQSAKPDIVLDLHNVIRTRILRLCFRARGVPVFVIDKGRREKTDLIKGKKKVRLRHSVDRYCDVFSRAGIDIKPSRDKSIDFSGAAGIKAAEIFSGKSLINIGVAPFAKHRLKEWPESSMIRLLQLIYNRIPCHFWFFGAKEESPRLEKLTGEIPNSNILAGKITLDEELAVISRLDFMIAMDSSNMHMAALLGTKVVSIWGATDPMAGFGAWMQPDDYMIRIPAEDLNCRPCTVYGKGECRRRDFACMNWLTPEIVFNKLVDLKII